MYEPILAGIILYNPDINRLIENLSSIQKQVKEIVLIDNASENIIQIEEVLLSYKNIQIIKNTKNLGVASALNTIISFANENSYNWVLTLDQDSVVSSNLISEYLKYIDQEYLSMITCQIVDRNFSKRESEDDKHYCNYVTRCITSGCLTNVKACLSVGGFEERLFIDFVDFDLCRSLISAGYKILKVNNTSILHELGIKTRVVKLFNVEFTSFNQNPIRNFFFFRNWIFFIRKHTNGIEAFKEYYRLNIQIFIILFYEKNDLIKIYSIFNGLCKGMKMSLYVK